MTAREAFDAWVEANAARGSDFYFVQIGANDGRSLGGQTGVTDDPIYDFVLKHGWSGLLVEPVEYLFERLLATYEGQPGLRFEKVAIAATPEPRTLYRLREDAHDLPWFYDKIGSFHLSVLMKEKEAIPDLEEHVVEEVVPCMSFGDLCEKHDVRHIDLLQIDTEGHDFEVLKMVDFDHLRPRAILYEHKHLSLADQKAAMTLLEGEEYECEIGEHDTFAQTIEQE